MTKGSAEGSDTTTANSAWRLTKLICCGVVVLSLLLCITIAVMRSNGLTQVTVTAFDADAEPRDHNIPLVKQKDALPDYEILVSLNRGETLRLGVKPNTSAVDGLTWMLNEPVSVSQVTGVRLQDQDKMVSDTITEVQITSETVTTDNYKFDFAIEQSLAVGVEAFFQTPIGLAISAAFFVAIFLIMVSGFAV